MCYLTFLRKKSKNTYVFLTFKGCKNTSVFGHFQKTSKNMSVFTIKKRPKTEMFFNEVEKHFCFYTFLNLIIFRRIIFQNNDF